ncbi:GntR family transcriptional regulator [Paraburkholderia sp. SARCC-3016]|uniref:GntR family transcriptional regulator n=1 Tax=Paraburkholderia sp. SARCC-3016 TaxID=3058611 RepID=UPI0028093563|nr:GntR family transcriptional regulator [Paraburkholderia sp. SARCC-3016]MDQ7978849.1 GntR family transcriptional regulator [Paraburkholderia sp. SARCC-3016]
MADISVPFAHSMKSPDQPLTVRQLAVQQLRTAILSGEFEPGEKLVEHELCALLGVSRPSVREALLSLQGEKLVTIVPNRGPFVATLDWDHAKELYNVRELLEGEAAALCCNRLDEAQLARMNQALDDFEAAVLADSANARIAATDAFYDVIQRGCGNRVIDEMLTSLHARVNVLRLRSMSQAGRGVASLREMGDIRDAIAAGLPKRARAAAVAHVREAARAAQAALAAADTPG